MKLTSKQKLEKSFAKKEVTKKIKSLRKDIQEMQDEMKGKKKAKKFDSKKWKADQKLARQKKLKNKK